MKSVHDLEITNSCTDCSQKRSGYFCNLAEDGLSSFEAIKVTRAVPKGTLLFIEGQASEGVFMLCKGKVKLSTCSKDGKIVILGVAEPGDLLGLSAAINGREYETTAEALELCQVNCIRTDELLDLLQKDPEACLNAARQLGRNCHAVQRQVCSLGLSDTSTEKLAKLFLKWSGNGSGGPGSVQIRNLFTHEEMAEMIGTSRETVTRALRYFRESGLVTIKGSEMIIHDRQRLRSVINIPNRFNWEL